MHDSPEFGDYVGAESCVDLKPDMENTASSHGGAAKPRRNRGRRGVSDREFPPPITSLTRAETLPSVMHKFYTGDGRLIITEEKVKRHEYLQARRSDGRLMLNLVPLDDAVEGSGGEEEEQLGEGISGGDVGIDDPTVECCKYDNLGVKPCGGFGVSVVPFARPVHTA